MLGRRQTSRMPTAIVTGANRGIGLGWVRHLAARDGMHVIATVRDRSATAELQELTAANGRIAIRDLDLNDERSIETFAAGVRSDGAHVDLLVQNAGVLDYGTLDQLSFESLEASFRSNVIGPAVLTRHLRPTLRHGSLIVLVTSRLASIAAANGRNGYPYRASKAALNMVAKQLAHELGADGIGVLPISPGHVRTRMNGMRAPIDVDTSVQGMLAVVDAFTLERSGEFVNYDGMPIAW